jgi:hypothetical protein
MAVIVQLLNGTNLCRDTGFQAAISTILAEGVRKGYSGELAVTLNQVAPGMAFLRVTRDTVIPNEVFIIPIIVTANTVISTAGNGFVILKADKTKINDGSANNADGTGIASIAVVSTLVGITDPYMVLATLSGGVITDARAWTQLDEKIIDDEFYYDQDLQASDSYQITIQGFKRLIDGKEYSFKANTTNTGAATLQVNSAAAKSIRKNYNSVLSDGDIVAGQIIVVRYDAANDFFQMLTPPGSNPGIPGKATQNQAIAGTDDSTYLTPLKGVYSAITWGNTELGTYGDAISAGDITANQNLMFQNPADKKWYKVLGYPNQNVQHRKLALALETGAIGATGKRLLRKGSYTLGTAFAAAVNPTVSNNQTGSDLPLGDVDADTGKAFQVSNPGPEFICTGVTISAKQQGAPSGPLNIYLVAMNLRASEGAGNPACYWDPTNNVMRGAILAQASIPQASFSGIYQDLPVAWSGGAIRFPQGATLYLVFSKGGFVNGSNFYLLNCSGFGGKALTGSTNTWGGSPITQGKWSLQVTSNPTLGYGVKCFDGSNAGSYTLNPSNPWAKVIGELVDNGATLFFDPDRNARQYEYADYQLSPNSQSGLMRVPLEFCPSAVKVTVTNRRQATTPITNMYKGTVRGDKYYSGNPNDYNLVIGNGNGGTATDDFLASGGNAGYQPAPIAFNNQQNFLHILRLEAGIILYNSYPTGNSFISGGSSGFSGCFPSFELEASYV